MAERKKPVMLMILDGWGIPTGQPGCALTAANLPCFRKLWTENPHTQLLPSGEAVGLPAGQMGNSEVGHLNIGAGRVVYQELTRISKAIREGELAKNPVLLDTLSYAKNHQGVLHLMGLVSDGGVHSHIEHLFALIDLAKAQKVPEVYIHCFLDGRDVPPTSAAQYLRQLQEFLTERQYGKIATVMGRYYAMDRDKRWERVEQAWRAMVLGEGQQVTDSIAAVEASYQEGITDEFVRPIVVCDAKGQALAKVTDGDGLIFFNFRADRAREITRTFTDSDFNGFQRPKRPEIAFACLTSYDVTIQAPVAFPPEDLTHTLGEVLAEHGLKQLRIAETEKYAHVTFFFNGGVEQPNPLEDRLLIPSPKVATYDLQPEMSAYLVRDAVIEKINAGIYDAIILNFANPDMVGHTGVMAAAVAAVEAVDACIGAIAAAIEQAGGVLLITADHGNVEQMQDDAGQPYTAHTTGPVPFIAVGSGVDFLRDGGSLQDIAPTMLEILGVPKPVEMTGKSLLQKK